MERKEKGRGGFTAFIKKNKLFVIIVAALLATALTVGGVLGIIAAVRESRAVASFEGVRAEAGVVNYLAATAKKDCMRILSAESGVTASDTPEFWARTRASDGVSFAEYMKTEVESYIRRVIIANYIFDMAGGLSDEEESYIATLTSDILLREADGDEKRFNSLAESMGFDYSDFCTATAMVYKYRSVGSLIYGSDGSGLTAEEREEYFATYSHVRLLFIRTESELAVDENGNYIYDNNGIVMYELSDDERAKRRADIEYIRELISNYTNGEGDDRMTPGVIDNMQAKYDYRDPYAKLGYYMSTRSSFVADSINDQHPDFVDMSASIAASAIAMSVGEYCEVECPFGVVFIYKDKNAAGAYNDADLEIFFSDFLTDAVDYHCDKEIRSLAGAVKIKDAFFKIDLVALPYNKTMYAI